MCGTTLKCNVPCLQNTEPARMAWVHSFVVAHSVLHTGRPNDFGVHGCVCQCGLSKLWASPCMDLSGSSAWQLFVCTTTYFVWKWFLVLTAAPQTQQHHDTYMDMQHQHQHELLGAWTHRLRAVVNIPPVCDLPGLLSRHFVLSVCSRAVERMNRVLSTVRVLLAAWQLAICWNSRGWLSM